MAVGVDDLAGNLLASAIFEGGRKPFASLKNFWVRRQDIIRAVEGAPDATAKRKSEKLAGAFDDLVRVLGSHYGKYTVQVEAFLVELQASAIPTALFGVLVCGKSDEEIKPAFDLIYNSFSPLPFTSEDLYRSLSAAIRARIDLASTDPIMLDAMRAIAEDLRGQIANLSKSLGGARSLTALTKESYLEVRVKVAKAIEAANRDLPVETERGTRRVMISKLVIPARLTRGGRPQQVQGVRRHRPDDDTISLQDFSRTLHRAVVLGDPGGGKSTLTQFLCFSMAKRLGVEQSYRDSHFDYRDLRLPLRVIVRTLERRRKNNAGYSIIDYLRDEFRGIVENNGVLLESFFAQTLATGKAVLLFDGLDEVLDVNARRDIAALIEQFVQAYSGCPVLITSRVVGYNDAPLGDDFDQYLLSRLSSAEIKKFAEKLIRAIGGGQGDAKVLAETFMKQTEANASDIRQNPLLLGLMVYIFKERGDVPDNRPEIYRSCSQLLFLKWDQRRDILFEYPDDFELLDLFGYLAVSIFGDPEREDGVSEVWLVSKIKAFFEDWYNDRAKASAAARSLVAFITGRAWVMTDVGPGVYKFTHRTFMEYFVARRLESESDSVADLLEGLYERVIRAEWDVVSHLALQIAASSGPKATRAVQALQALLSRPGRTADEEFNLLQFVARAQAYLPVPENRYQETVNELMSRASNLPATANFRGGFIFSMLVASSRKKTPLLRDLIAQFLRSGLCSDNKQLKLFSKVILSNDHHRVTRYSSPQNEPDGEYKSMLGAIRLEFKVRMLDEAKEDLESARLFVLTYGDNLSELWDVHGVELLFAPPVLARPKVLGDLGYRVAIQILRALESGSEIPSDYRDFIGKAADFVVKKGIPATVSRAGVSSNRNGVLDLADESLRALYFANRSPKKQDGKFRLMQESAIVILALMEVSLFRRSRTRIRKEHPGRIDLVVRHLPPDLFQKMIRSIDSKNEKPYLSDWISARISFVDDMERKASG